MNDLAKAIDRAVEDARTRALDEQQGPVCPECGDDLRHMDGETYACDACEADVEFFGPEEDWPQGWCDVREWED